MFVFVSQHDNSRPRSDLKNEVFPYLRDSNFNLVYKSESVDNHYISAKYATDNQWIKCEIPNLANLYCVI